jgi:electron transfer flavoprotein alpha subunit
MDINDLSALLGEDLSTESAADIWVVAPNGEDGSRLVGEARRLADGLGCYVQAVTEDEAGAHGLVAAGADRVHVASGPARYLESQRPEFVFFPAAQADEAAHYAQRAGAGLISGARSLSIEEGTRALLGSHAVYGGEYSHDLAVTSVVKVATVDAAALPAPYADPGRSGDISLAAETSEPARPRDVGKAGYAPPAWRPLSKAQIIVSVGRGVRDEDGLALARQLAEALGAQLAGDRSALASGWVDEAHLVDVTGQEVAPELYLALGVYGDTMHNAAIAGARRVIAVHSQASAPVFAVADLAVVAEPKAWLPLVLQSLAAGK